jgi:hypothetical protein
MITAGWTTFYERAMIQWGLLLQSSAAKQQINLMKKVGVKDTCVKLKSLSFMGEGRYFRTVRSLTRFPSSPPGVGNVCSSAGTP